MKSMSPFQLLVTGAFIVLTILGVGIFAAFGGMLGGSSVGPVVIWGTMDSQAMDSVINTLRAQDKSFQDVSYQQRDPATYEHDLINAIAAGAGPDLLMLNQEELGAFGDKVRTIPYSAVSQSTFTNSYIDEAQVFLNNQGAWALPLSVDPLVMYWNRDLLASAGVGQPPQTWNDFLTLSPKITSLDSRQNVSRSAVALGEWSNIAHAKAILSALFMQAGDPIVTRGQDGLLAAVFGQTPSGAPANPAESALRFYTEFANPAKTTYSWNRSLPLSTQMFTAGDLAVYFGYASELPKLAQVNPNLHFGTALLPQLQGSSLHTTYGLMTGLAVSRTAANPTGALTIAQKLSSQAGISAFVSATNLPPVRRDVAIDTSSNADLSTFVQSSLIARGWFVPDETATDQIFKTMIESVTTGQSEPAVAVNEALQQMQAFFNH